MQNQANVFDRILVRYIKLINISTKWTKFCSPAPLVLKKAKLNLHLPLLHLFAIQILDLPSHILVTIIIRIQQRQ